MPDRPAHLVRLTSRPNELEAGIVVATLEENGIRAAATGAATAGFRAEAPGWVHVLIAEDDLPRAEALLNEIGQSQDDVDWSQVDVGQPEEAEIPGASPSWTRRRFWHHVAFFIVVLVVMWFVAGVIGMLVALIRGV
jgi:Putative prokaryotic signal transducing protein